jgi:hypothetical protein
MGGQRTVPKSLPSLDRGPEPVFGHDHAQQDKADLKV